MKKIWIIATASILLLGSCDTYTGTGAYAGASLGSVLGSAIGGIAGGPRGADYGTLIGMATGAAVGGSVGAKADERKKEAVENVRVGEPVRAHLHGTKRYPDTAARRFGYEASPYDDDRNDEPADDAYLPNGDTAVSHGDDYGSGFDSTNSGDDRIADFTGSEKSHFMPEGQTAGTKFVHSSVSSRVDELAERPLVEIRGMKFRDAGGDGVLNRGERGEIVFEVINRGQLPLSDVLPMVTATGCDGHVLISPSVSVDQILPGKGIRYTAVVKADRGLGDGSVRFDVNVKVGGEVVSRATELDVPTRR